MPEWFQLFDTEGACVYELIAYTSAGALSDAHKAGYTDAVTARRLYAHTPTDCED